jgi:hypothetical protein
MMTRDVRGSYVHFSSPMKSYLLRVLAIAASAVPGTWLAWLAMTALGLSGIPLALATVFSAMVFSVAIFAGLIAAGRALKVVK